MVIDISTDSVAHVIPRHPLRYEGLELLSYSVLNGHGRGTNNYVNTPSLPFCGRSKAMKR